MLFEPVFTTRAQVDEFLKRRKNKLRVVVLDCFYDSYADERVQNLFRRIVTLKIKGYRDAYPYGVLPVDDGDIFGVHVLLCEEVDGELIPLTGFKSTSLSRCRTFKRQFPAYGLLAGLGLPDHERAIREIIDRAVKNGEEVSYNSSWTIDPSVRGDKELARFCRDLSAFFLVGYYQDAGIKNVLAGAVVRFHVDALKRFIGFSPIALGKRDLDPIHCQFVFDEPVALMYMRQPKGEARLWGRVFEQIWKDRLIISAPAEADQKRKAA